MSENKPIELSDEALLEEVKKMKSTKFYDALIVGLLLGVAIYSTVNNGFGLLTFLPLAYVPVAAKNKARDKELEKLLNERGLK